MLQGQRFFFFALSSTGFVGSVLKQLDICGGGTFREVSSVYI